MKTLAIVLLLSVTAAHAQLATSPNYTLLHGDPGQGGGPVQNAGGTVTADLSTGGAASGVATVGTLQANGGFTGQLYDAISIEVTPTPGTIDESSTSQLSASAVMDDDTTLVLDPFDVLWTIEDGFIEGITPGGLVTAGNVFADTSGDVSGFWLGLEDFATINLLNTGDDDFGSYAGDQLDDDWQVGFFGFDNPDAAPHQDPDTDSQDNRFENLAGVDPTDVTSFFSARLEAVLGQTSNRRVVFSPFFTDRNYTLLGALDLDAASFVPVSSTTSSDTGDGGEGTITDTDATEPLGFYRIQIEKP